MRRFGRARLSLTLRLALGFAAITLLVFSAVGTVLYQTLANGIQAQDDLDIVLAARHYRRLANEIATLDGIREHETRLDSLVLGNNAFLMQVRDSGDRLLIEHNTSGASVGPLPPAAPDARLTQADIHQWRDPDGHLLRAISTAVVLRDGSIIHVLVAREMSDRIALRVHYRTTILLTIGGAVLAVLLLSYALVRRAFRPLIAVAESAAHVNVHRLDARLDLSQVPPEFDPLGQSLNSMLARLEGGFERLSQFVSDLAHDMRTPLSNMRGASEVALARPRTVDEYQSLIASNLEECERLSRMIENVLFLARAEHPQFVKNTRRFDASVELARIAAYFEGLSEDAGVGIELAARGTLDADVELFRRAVSNLLANALRYTPRGQIITLRAARNETGMRLSIENPGTPIRAAHLDKLFDRFYRADPSRTQAGGSTGTGLGLAIVRTIMELHGGTAWVESDERSTRFYLQFKDLPAPG